jgi:hypothetical protein
MPTGTNQSNAVTQATQERDARMLRESLSRCRRNVSIPLRDEEVRNLIKRVEHDRAKPCEHIMALEYDAFSRGAPRADVEAFFRTGLAIVGSWYEENEAAMDLPTLIRLETQAQAVGDMAEIDLAIDQSPKTVADAADLLRGHLVALDRLVTACERQQVAAARASGPSSTSSNRMVA